MIKTILTVVAVLTLMSCAPKDKTQVQLEDKIGELSLNLGGTSVAIDYEIASYKVVDTITTRKTHTESLETAIDNLKSEEQGLDKVLTIVSANGYDATQGFWSEHIGKYEVMISDSKANIKELKAKINDNVLGVKYEVVIGYYNPILKVDVTQKKLVTLMNIKKH